MRAGRLQTRRIKMRRRRLRLLAVLLLLLACGGGLFLAFKGEAPLKMSFKEQAEDLSPAEATLSLPGEVWYALQLGAFSTREAALSEAEKLIPRGAAGYVLQDAGTHRLLAAAYDTRAAAQTVSERLTGEHGIETYVLELSRGALVARCKGQKAQLDALSDAYGCLSACAKQLYALSCGLDAKDKAQEEILDALLSEETTLRTILSRLTRLFPDGPEAVKALLEGGTALLKALSDARQAQGATGLSGKLKYAQLLTLDILRGYAKSLYSADTEGRTGALQVVQRLSTL